ncbi:peptidoglycan D,D-transpeptidase FtsI family protein [Streptomyces sp. TR02-1]|uniref:peptidoglycan D,D-transpeptidase FtsI family protein n=1 Tax=Streptomyces sp. TR02-1 TaxID=3385977 RepID=UPI0039A263BC
MTERQEPRRRGPRPAAGNGRAGPRKPPPRQQAGGTRSAPGAGARREAARKPASRQTARGGKSGARPPAGPPPRPRPGAARPGPARPLRLAGPLPRLRLVGFVITLVVLVFAVRLLQVQAVDAGSYAEAAAVNRYVTVPLAAERGAMTDRDGVPLASTVDAYDITADPYMFTPGRTDLPDAPARAAALLAPVLHEDEEELTEKLSRDNTRYVLLARKRTPQDWRRVSRLKDRMAAKAAERDEVNVLAGVFAEEHAKRVYPGGELAAGVLGFVNAAGEGGGGLEARLDRTLSGTDGKITYAQSSGRRIPTAGADENPAVPGSDVELTLDRDIQWAAQRAIAAQVEASRADSGYVVVQDVRSGEILALADAPTFDPNDLGWADPDSLGNGAIQHAYEPGSTLKAISMAAVLEEGVASPRTHVTVPNRLPRADHAFADDIDHPTWHLTLNGVLAKSSNIGTILATEQLGDSRAEANRTMYRYLRRFGLGQESGLGFPGETSGLLAEPQDWSASQPYTIAFGQGVSLNAVQLASVYSTIANGGVRVQPSLVRGTTGEDGVFTPADAPPTRRVISGKTAGTLAAMLETAVSDDRATGTTARIPGYLVAGKTGTSNRVDPETGRYHGYTSSFAGFAPADKPRITVYCAVQNPRKGSYFGSEVCGPVFKEVMSFSLKTLGVPPTGGEPARLPVTFDPDAAKHHGGTREGKDGEEE